MTRRSLLTLAFVALLATSTVLGGPNEPKSAKWPLVRDMLSIELAEWAEPAPVATANCGSAIPPQPCCDGTVPASAGQCAALARDINQGQIDFVASSIAPCIAAQVAWKCDLYFEEGVAKLDCQTVPGLLSAGVFLNPNANFTNSDGQRLSDVALCASRLAAGKYPL